ncbi:MAG: hypothetical protein QM673_08485 [Gordonia sp. (in: high G+C Gram-positive bacteria)]
MPKRYPEEFRRKVRDLVAAGRPITQVCSRSGYQRPDHLVAPL